MFCLLFTVKTYIIYPRIKGLVYMAQYARIKFQGLKKSDFINALYELKREMLEDDGISLPALDEKVLKYIDKQKSIQSIYNVELNIQFDDEYIYFMNDECTLDILNILFKMKIDSGSLYDNLKDDIIFEFEYKDYLKDIYTYEILYDKLDQELIGLDLTAVRYKRMKQLNNPKYREENEIQLLERKTAILKEMKKLKNDRLVLVVKLLQLEGNNICINDKNCKVK